MLCALKLLGSYNVINIVIIKIVLIVEFEPMTLSIKNICYQLSPLDQIPFHSKNPTLCVVVVTISQYSKGLPTTEAATSPLMCAISIIRNAPTASAIFPMNIEIKTN